MAILALDTFRRETLLEELKALGSDKIWLNKFNDNDELLYLVESVESLFLKTWN
jgi:hypothetical protein